ncbi:MAG: hypothetical protein ACQKBY_12245, partial [Verrucomicrobiales bacterium]
TDARSKFAEVVTKYKKLDMLGGNYSTLAYYYQMECTRKLGELEALKELKDNFLPEPLLDASHHKQLENYKYWDAVRTESWERLIELARSEEEKHFPGAQRAQIAYCLGLAYENTGKTNKALTAYNEACISDFAASEEVTRKSALSIMRLLKENAEVQTAISLFGTDDFNANSNGAQLLKEGVAIAKLWGTALGGGAELPKEYADLLKYEF